MTQPGREYVRLTGTQQAEARSLDESMERINGAIELPLKGQGETDSGLEFVGVQRVRLAA